MRKLWTIAWKDIRNAATDRNLVVIMLITPLALSTIIALAFSNLTGGGAPLRDIPVALVNLDEGAPQGFNAGNLFVNLLVPGAPELSTGIDTTCDQVNSADSAQNFSLLDLTDVVLLDDAGAARAAVDRGDYAAAIIIPPGFSHNLTYSQERRTLIPTPVEVYGNAGRPISTSVIRSIAEGITNQIMTGQVTIAATIETLIDRTQNQSDFGDPFAAIAGRDNFQPNFGCAFTSGLNPIQIVQNISQDETAETGINFLAIFGSSLAIFFALFTANGGATNILQESRNGTLQRLLVSPTSRLQIMFGKTIGVFGTVLLQLVFLFIALTLVNSFLAGAFSPIWGNNWTAIAAVLIVSALAVSGVGMVTAAAATSPEQANVIGGIVAMFMGVSGGAFFRLPSNSITQVLSSLSIVTWGSDAFIKLSQDGDIRLNLVILGVIGTLLFTISLVIFNRRQDI